MRRCYWVKYSKSEKRFKASVLRWTDESAMRMNELTGMVEFAFAFPAPSHKHAKAAADYANKLFDL